MAVDHYENFPVASILLPARLRRPVVDIYRFARAADDIADEGDAPDAQRLTALAGYRSALENFRAGGAGPRPDEPGHAVLQPLAGTIAAFGLPFEPFFDLLDAFEQDVRVRRYPDQAALFDYCRRSANPVGRLMLRLHGVTGTENLARSDAICTGLQLTNFWQDIALDWRKSRVYVPQDNLARYGIDDGFIADHACPAAAGAAERAGRPSASWGGEQGRAWRALMRSLVEDSRLRLLAGLPLVNALPARAGLELKLVILGGLRILERLDQLHYDMFRYRPTLRGRDWGLMFLRACRPSRQRTHHHPDTGNP